MEVAAITLSLISVIVTTVGWFVNSWLNSRTQRQALINSLTNDARIKLVDAIRHYHQWCIDIQCLVASMPVDDITSLGQTDEHHKERLKKLHELSTDSRRLIWLQRLEEYEPLFPGTALVRIELQKMTSSVCHLARELAKQHAPKSPPPKEEMNKFDNQIFDLLSLAWDLRVHLQNRSIGQITGTKIQERQPLDQNAVKLISDNHGNLILYWPVHN